MENNQPTQNNEFNNNNYAANTESYCMYRNMDNAFHGY